MNSFTHSNTPKRIALRPAMTPSTTHIGVVEPLVALVIGLEPHHDVLSSDALPFRVLAEDRPPLHDKGDLCPVLRGHKTPGVGQHASVASSSRMVRPLNGTRKPGAFGASIAVPVTRSFFASVWLYE